MTQEDGKLIFGTFELGLVKPPISLRPSEENPSAQTEAKINFSLMEPDSKRDVFTAEFIPNNEKQYTTQEWWEDSEEDGVDIPEILPDVEQRLLDRAICGGTMDH